MQDSFRARGSFDVDGRSYKIARLSALTDAGFDIDRLPFAMRILLENLLRHEDGVTVPKADIEAVAARRKQAQQTAGAAAIRQIR